MKRKLAFLYAGQGTQRAGMGADLYEKYPEFRAVLDGVCGLPELDFDLKSLCFDGPQERLNQTRYTQPCMVAFAAGVTAVLRARGVEADMAAGLSLGEYSALACAGVFDPLTAVALVAFRGRVMAEAVGDRPCGMAAVLHLDREPLRAVCQQAADQTGGIVEIANFNCPGQIVIGGDQAAVDRACELAKEAGARRCMPLQVSGPFHTSLMKPAGDALREKFQSVEFHTPNLPVYFNCTGTTLRDGEQIPALLERQVQSSVYLQDSIQAMSESGAGMALEIGPGKALTGFVKKTVKGMKTCAIDTADDLEAAIEAVRAFRAEEAEA